MKADKTILTLTLSAVLILATAVIRPVEISPEYNQHAFWAGKMLWQHQFDIVFAGDSRTNQDVSPQVIETVLHKNNQTLNIANFAFQAAAFTPDYLSRIKTVLKPESPKKAIILGITPLAFTTMSRDDNRFKALSKENHFELLKNYHWKKFNRFFRPYNVPSIIRGNQPTGLIQTFHEDGWAESRFEPENSEAAIEKYSHLFNKNPATEAMQKNLLRQVRQWKQHNIRVLGFTPPTTEEMRALEKEKSGFDEDTFKQKFIDAGGEWLALPTTGYYSYDSSHLRGDAARQFSKDLANALADTLN